MTEEYNWTKDSDLVRKVVESTWLAFATRAGLEYEFQSKDSFYSFLFSKKDLRLKIRMSRTLPFECTFQSIATSSLNGELFDLYEYAIPTGKDLPWFFENEGLGLPPSELDKEATWIHAMNNQVFLLEKFCVELLKTGNIVLWLEKHKVN